METKNSMDPLAGLERERVIVIYHANCPDGFFAALTVWLRLGQKKGIEYFPSTINRPPPDVKGKIVFILDMAYSKETLLEMIQQAKNLLVIDHHKTNQEALSSIPDRYRLFDLQESGATLAWKYFRPSEPLPLIYKYVRDRDLWLKELDGSDAVHVALDQVLRSEDGPFSFELALPYLEAEGVGNLIAYGRTLLSYQEGLIKKALSAVYFCPVRITGRETLSIVAYINTTVLSSDIGARCLEVYPFVDFCACLSYDVANEMTHVALRSTDEREDVSLIAKDHGGGGHRNSSGCVIDGLASRLSYEHFDSTLIWCLHKGRPFRVDFDQLVKLTPGYIDLVKRKFPGSSLSILASI
jgi:hypothetical protein